MPVKEFAEFTLPKGLGLIQSYRSGWTPSQEPAEVGGASPCWIVAVHMGQFVHSQHYRKPELIYGWKAWLPYTYSARHWWKGSELSQLVQSLQQPCEVSTIIIPTYRREMQYREGNHLFEFNS